MYTVKNKPWKIWVETFNSNGEKNGSWVSSGYSYKQNAVRAAKKLYNRERYRWIVAQRNPFCAN